MNRKRFWIAACVSLCVTAALTAGLFYMEYRSYLEKMEIIGVMISEEEAGGDNLSTAAALLRHETHESVTDAAGALTWYGFDESYTDEYRRSMHRTWLFTTGAAGCVWMLFVLFLLHSMGAQELRREREFAEIGMLISGMRDCAKQDRIQTGVQDAAVQDKTAAWQKDGDFAWQQLLEQLSLLEESVALRYRQAQEEKEETKTLVTDISHQLKTPVAALKTSFELCRMQDISETERTEFMERCSVQIERLTELVGALVGISRMETGMIQITLREQKIFDTLLLAVNRIYPDAAAKDIEIALEAEEAGEELILPHDAKWLSEAFLNVLENAVKYSPAHSTVTIRMIRMNVFLRIEIEDEGIGIPKAEWNQIFRRFYRGASGEVQSTPGSGVGLYLARRIVAEHHGTLTVKETGKGCGSRFVFQLPYE